MGWCYEFGTEIRAGCSHPMVAGVSSCRCPDCGADCIGKFSGCSAVWDRGPIKITIGPVERNGRANGNGSRGPVLLSEPVATFVTLPSASGAESGAPAELAPVLQAIWAELQVLTRRVDRLSDSMVGRDVATTNALKTTEELPDRIVTGLAAALSSQHQTIMSEVQQAIAQSVPVTTGTEDGHVADRLAAQLADISDLFDKQVRCISDRLDGLESRRPRSPRRVRETTE